MARTNGERLAVVETEVKNAREEMQEIRADVKTILRKLEDQSNRYVTRREGQAVVGVISVIITVLTFLQLGK